MKKISVEKIILLSFLLFLISFVADAASYNFTRSLTVGSRGEDVRQLQMFLNNYSPQTQVAVSGVGSPGNETDYFGSLTNAAVARFQNMNREEILTPVGLTNGTGYFGPSTIAFISGTPQVNTQNTNQQIQTPLQTPQTTIQTQNVVTNQGNFERFLFISTLNVSTDDIIIVGSDAEISNLDFYLDDEELDKTCRHPHMCELEIDNIDPGKYTLRTSDPGMKLESITVLDTDKKPVIDIDKIKLNEWNQVKGENFTDKIKLHTAFGILDITTDDNDSFKFQIQSSITSLPKELAEGPVFVENSDGRVSDIIIVEYEI